MGAIQRSNIGPLLLISFIYELADLLGPMFVTAKFFTDDLKVYAEVITAINVTCFRFALDRIVALCNIVKIGSCKLQSVSVVFYVPVSPLLALTFKLMVTCFPWPVQLKTLA